MHRAWYPESGSSRVVIVFSVALTGRNLNLCAQSEYGDLYKVSLEYNQKTVTELRVKYFDTIPRTISICVLKTGFLFAASEFGNHALYQFAVRPSL